MSPVDPLSPFQSPISPMDLSPTSAIEAGLMLPIISPRSSTSTSTAVTVPRTPALAASDTLPRLVTNFQNNKLRGISSEVQLALLTPSPLTLRSGTWSGASSPETAMLVAENGRPFSMRYEHAAKLPATAETMFDVLFGGSGSHRRQFNDSAATGDLAKSPTLHRQNAMEGLENMEMDEDSSASDITVVTSLPIRSKVTLDQPSSHDRNSASTAPSPSRSSTATITTSLSENPTTFPTRPTTRNFSRKHTRSPAISKTTSPPRSTITGRIHHRTRSPPPKVKVIARNSQNQKQAHLRALITQLSHPLVPLVSVKTGQPHPDFPRTLLSYHLLTHAQLDSLARHYHQTIDAGDERWLYPAPIAWGKIWCGDGDAESGTGSVSISESAGGAVTQTRRHLVSLEAKRRRWGRFIGLRGCDSPVTVSAMPTATSNGSQQRQEEEEEEGIVEKMERQWREALRRAEDERNVRDKLWGRRF